MANIVKAAMIAGLVLVLAWIVSLSAKPTAAIPKSQALYADEYPAGYQGRQPLSW